MKIDIHCHVTGNGRDISKVDEEVYFNPYDNAIDGKLISVWLIYKYIETMLILMGADTNHDISISSDEYMDFIYRSLAESEEIEGIVLLAMDAVYDSAGTVDVRKTDLWVTNDLLYRKVNGLNGRFKRDGISGKRFYFGASVNPNRKDWKDELNNVIDKTEAVLIKWIPSAMHIDVDKVSDEFYAIMAKNNIPLLCHVGPELSFVEGMKEENRGRDDFLRLQKPIDCGVKVIAAHCALPLPILSAEPDRFDEFKAFMESNNKDGKISIWADTSALSLTNRLHLLDKVKKNIKPQWLVHGSDFPIPIDSGILLRVLIPDLKSEDYEKIRTTKNPFDKDARIKKAFGFDATILGNAEAQKLLRIK